MLSGFPAGSFLPCREAPVHFGQLSTERVDGRSTESLFHQGPGCRGSYAIVPMHQASKIIQNGTPPLRIRHFPVFITVQGTTGWLNDSVYLEWKLMSPRQVSRTFRPWGVQVAKPYVTQSDKQPLMRSSSLLWPCDTEKGADEAGRCVWRWHLTLVSWWSQLPQKMSFPTWRPSTPDVLVVGSLSNCRPLTYTS